MLQYGHCNLNILGRRQMFRQFLNRYHTMFVQKKYIYMRMADLNKYLIIIFKQTKTNTDIITCVVVSFHLRLFFQDNHLIIERGEKANMGRIYS